MPQIVGDWGAIVGNPLIAEQCQYNKEDQARWAAEHINRLNPDQHAAFEKITSAITNKTGEIFFLHGPGGTSKTYLYNTLCYYLFSQEKIVLCVASLGIAALLLKGGHTAHSAFKIPIPCHESSVCGFTKSSHMGELICKTDLVIWDEAPMQHRHNMETVDHSFKDMCSCDKPFGGLTCVFSGDFQQILPVIFKGSHAQIVGACIQRSILWRSMTILHLYQNMHLNLNTSIEAEKNFAKWQLEVGQGKYTDDGGSISLPEHFECSENTVESLINTIYPGIHTVGLSNDYFSERTILCGINNDVDNFNKEVLEKFHGDVQI